MRVAGHAQRILAARISRAVMRNHERALAAPATPVLMHHLDPLNLLGTLVDTQLIGDFKLRAHGRIAARMLEGATHVEFHVSFSRAGSDRGGGDRAAARPDQYVARRLAQPLAKADAVARAVPVRRHHCHHGDNLGPRPLVGEDTGRHSLHRSGAHILLFFFLRLFGLLFGR